VLDRCSPVRFERLRPEDFAAIERQPSQERLLGADIDAVTVEEAEALASQPVAWTAFHQGRIAALFGIAEQFPGKHGVAWSILARGIGTAHLAVTRRARVALEGCGLNRVELIARAAQTPFLLRNPHVTDCRSDLPWAVDRSRISPECRWAAALGFTPAHVLHGYGAKCETHVLYEWFGRV
jgi:hypothetical protein